MPATSRSSVLQELRSSIAKIEGASASARSAKPRSGLGARKPFGPLGASGSARGAASPPSEASPEPEAAFGGTDAGAEAPESLEAQAERAYQKVLRCAAAREQSTARMRDKLLRAEFAPEAADQAIERACRAGVLDDARYAEALVRATLAAGKGLRIVETEVDKLGVDIRSLDAYRDHLAEGREGEVDRALAAIRARPPRSKNKREAAFRRCVAKGFSTDVAAAAARIWCEEG